MKSNPCNHCLARSTLGFGYTCNLGFKTEVVYYFKKAIGFKPQGFCTRPSTREEYMRMIRMKRVF